MEQIFETVLRSSLFGSVIILVILGLRLALKAVPKRYICLLWILAGLRLLVPFTLESPFSLQPDPNDLTHLTPTHTVTQPEAETPVITPAVGEDIQLPQVDVNNDAVSQPDMMIIDTAAMAARVWAVVAGGFLVYMAGSYLMLKRKVRSAVAVDDSVYECGSIDSPFLLGYLKPRIYLPTDLPVADIDHILAHEKVHLRRLDHWTKLLGFVCLAVHWFNPLVWVAYGLLCRDMEMACDEDVVAELDAAGRKAYSGALLRCVAGSRVGAVCPVAFGEVSVKQRIPKVLNYRKPTFWIGVVAGAVIVAVAVCFLTNPVPLTQEERYIAQCREAFEAWRDMETRHLLLETRYDGGQIVNDFSSSDYWRDGDRYLRITSVPLSGNDHMSMAVLAEDKVLFRQYISGNSDYGFSDSGWMKSDMSVSSVHSWVDLFEWNVHAVEFVDHKVDGDRTVITLSVTENPDRCDEEYTCQENPYTLHFSFAADGSLISVMRSYWFSYEPLHENDSGVQWAIETYKLIPSTREQITEKLDKGYADAEAGINALPSDRPYDKSEIPGG